MREVRWIPGAVAPGANIDLPANSPAIGRVIAARLSRLTEAAPNTWTNVAATPTRVDADTITLGVATTAPDELTLQYEEVGERAVP